MDIDDDLTSQNSQMFNLQLTGINDTSQHCDKSRASSSQFTHISDTHKVIGNQCSIMSRCFLEVWSLQTVQTKSSDSEKLETKYFEVKFSTLQNENFLSVESCSAVLK